MTVILELLLFCLVIAFIFYLSGSGDSILKKIETGSIRLIFVLILWIVILNFSEDHSENPTESYNNIEGITIGVIITLGLLISGIFSNNQAVESPASNRNLFIRAIVGSIFIMFFWLLKLTRKKRWWR